MTSRGLLNAGVSLLALGLASVVPFVPARAMASCSWTDNNCYVASGSSIASTTIGSALGTLSNSGTIFAGVSGAAGVSIASAGSLSLLTTTGTISALGGAAETGVSVAGSLGTLSNSGVIDNVSIGVANSGTISALTNAASGTIAGTAVGIQVSSATASGALISVGSIGQLSNSGLISGGTGIRVTGGGIGALTNAAGATIAGTTAGIVLAGATASGALVSPGSIGTLSNSGTISGGSTGIRVTGGVGSLANAGLISGGDEGIVVQSNVLGGRLDEISLASAGGSTIVGGIGTLSNTGTISGGSTGIVVRGGSIGALINSGTISGGTRGIAVVSLPVNGGGGLGDISLGSTGTSILPGSIGTLSNSGTIIGGETGVYVNGGSIGILANTGTIIGTDGYGLHVASGSIGTLFNSGLISGGTSGVWNQGTIGGITNTGTITGEYGLYNTGTIGTVANSGTIVGVGGSGLGNAGTIGAVTNTGVIVGDTSGVYNSGTIGALTNSGLITGNKTGIRNSGTIGAIANSGLITGGSYALYNTGSLGVITNSGTIAGNIYSTSDLTIAGGTTTWGELDGTDGAAGTMGTITVTTRLLEEASNVVPLGVGTLNLVSGLIWLNDNVVGNVSNTGATVRLSQAVAVSGNYAQSAGGLAIVAASPASYGYLTVGGSASVTDSAVTLSGHGLNGGQSYTIVRPDGTGTYTGDTVSVTTRGLTATLSEVGDDLVVSLAGSAATYRDTGLTLGSMAGRIGGALDVIAAGTPSADMQTILNDIDAIVSNKGAAQAIRELGPAQGVPGYQMAFSAAGVVSNAIGQHLQSAQGKGGGDGGDVDGFGNRLWGQFLGGGASRTTTGETAGYDMAMFGMAVGADHQFTDSLLGGAALSWVHNLTHGSDGADAKSSLDSYQLTFYGTYRVGPLFFDTQAGVGYDRFQQKRNISFLGRTASANYDGALFVLREQAGYDIPLADSLKLTPLAGLTLLRSEAQGYTEYGAGAASLAVGDQGVTGLTHDIGARITWSTETPLGTLKPELRAEWVHDYQNSAVVTSASLAGAGFASMASRIAPNGAQLGLAATLESRHNLSFRAEYTADLRSNYQSHVGQLQAAWGF